MVEVEDELEDEWGEEDETRRPVANMSAPSDKTFMILRLKLILFGACAAIPERMDVES